MLFERVYFQIGILITDLKKKKKKLQGLAEN